MSERVPVSIAGVGDSRCTAEDSRSTPEMVLCAVEEALDDSQLKHEDIDAVVTASVDLFDGLTASNIAVTEVVGAVEEVLGSDTIASPLRQGMRAPLGDGACGEMRETFG